MMQTIPKRRDMVIGSHHIGLMRNIGLRPGPGYDLAQLLEPRQVMEAREEHNATEFIQGINGEITSSDLGRA